MLFRSCDHGGYPDAATGPVAPSLGNRAVVSKGRILECMSEPPNDASSESDLNLEHSITLARSVPRWRICKAVTCIVFFRLSSPSVHVGGKPAYTSAALNVPDALGQLPQIGGEAAHLGRLPFLLCHRLYLP